MSAAEVYTFQISNLPRLSDIAWYASSKPTWATSSPSVIFYNHRWGMSMIVSVMPHMSTSKRDISLDQVQLDDSWLRKQLMRVTFHGCASQRSGNGSRSQSFTFWHTFRSTFRSNCTNLTSCILYATNEGHQKSFLYRLWNSDWINISKAKCSRNLL